MISPHLRHHLNKDLPPTPLTGRPPHPTLRSRLIGTWELESFISYPTDPSSTQTPVAAAAAASADEPTTPPNPAPYHPMTEHATGFIMYTHDGYMSAQLLTPGQARTPPPPASEYEAQVYWADAAHRCIAYAGPFYVTEQESPDGSGAAKEVLRHEMIVSSMPQMQGDVQRRRWRFEEEEKVLVLGPDEPVPMSDREGLWWPELRWRRVLDNWEARPRKEDKKGTGVMD